MLNQFVGPVDFSGALVLIGLGAAITILVCVWMLRPSEADKAKNFALQERKLAVENESAMQQRRFNHEQELARIKWRKDVDLAQISDKTLVVQHDDD